MSFICIIVCMYVHTPGCACMFVCTFMFMCLYVCVLVSCAHRSSCTCEHAYLCVHVHEISVCVCSCEYTDVCHAVCLCSSMYICVPLFVYSCCTYTYTMCGDMCMVCVCLRLLCASIRMSTAWAYVGMPMCRAQSQKTLEKCEPQYSRAKDLSSPSSVTPAPQGLRPG